MSDQRGIDRDLPGGGSEFRGVTEIPGGRFAMDRRILLLSVFAGVLVCLGESALDILVFEGGRWEEALTGRPLLLRLAVFVAFVTFGVIASRALARRKQAERSAREHSARLRSVFRAAPVGIGVIANRVFLDANDRVCEMTGYAPGELIGQSSRILYPSQEEFERVGRDKYGQIERCGIGTTETQWVRKDGSTMDVLLSSAPIDPEDLAVGVTFTALDITDRKTAERELKASLETSADIVTSIPAGLFTYQRADGRLRLVNANPAAERLTGVGLSEYQGREFDEIWPNARELGITDLWLSVFETGESYRSEDVAYHDDQREGIYRVTVFPLPGDRLAVAFEDVTELRRHQGEREKLIADLEAQNAELDRFAYAVSHDLKSPLITIRGYVGLLEEDLAQGDMELVKESLARIDGAAERMAQLLDEILELSRIGRLISPSQRVPLNELAAEAIENLQGMIARSRVEIDIDPDLPIVFGDRRRVGEVLQNLLENAVKYMGEQPQPRISIGAEVRGEEALCYVRDNGSGIESMYHERIFRLFDQLDPSSEGSGVGLALVRRIIEVHGGNIWVESEGSGRGSTFWFTLPIN